MLGSHLQEGVVPVLLLGTGGRALGLRLAAVRGVALGTVQEVLPEHVLRLRLGTHILAVAAQAGAQATT